MTSPPESSAIAMIEGGLGIFCLRMYRLMTYGSQTLVSYETYWLVGTEKTSAK